jgi:hypothetical protein
MPRADWYGNYPLGTLDALELLCERWEIGHTRT